MVGRRREKTVAENLDTQIRDNAAFILPLLAVFALGAVGTGSRRLSNWSAQNVVPSKLLLGGVFLALAVLLAILAA
jgi:hypothetical protein